MYELGAEPSQEEQRGKQASAYCAASLERALALAGKRPVFVGRVWHCPNVVPPVCLCEDLRRESAAHPSCIVLRPTGHVAVLGNARHLQSLSSKGLRCVRCCSRFRSRSKAVACVQLWSG